MPDLASWLDLLTNACWIALAVVGIGLRVRRLLRLHRIVLPRPLDPADVDYLASVKRSTRLRLGTKLVLLVGGLTALTHAPVAFWVWRVGVIAILALMVAETLSVDRVRERLGMPLPSGRETAQEQP